MCSSFHIILQYEMPQQLNTQHCASPLHPRDIRCTNKMKAHNTTTPMDASTRAWHKWKIDRSRIGKLTELKVWFFFFGLQIASTLLWSSAISLVFCVAFSDLSLSRHLLFVLWCVFFGMKRGLCVFWLKVVVDSIPRRWLKLEGNEGWRWMKKMFDALRRDFLLFPMRWSSSVFDWKGMRKLFAFLVNFWFSPSPWNESRTGIYSNRKICYETQNEIQLKLLVSYKFTSS